MNTLILFLALISGINSSESFFRSQLAQPRVRAAVAQKDSLLRSLSISKGLPYPPKKLFLRAFKQEAMLEVWSAFDHSDSLMLLTSYPICGSSGLPGPKARMGDAQVPEGVYFIDRFNPQSQFMLSLEVSYPNVVDRARSAGNPPGGDIYIHGDCVTIGCLPITDDKVKELYVLSIGARKSGQWNIPIHIFPSRFRSPSYETMVRQYPQHQQFWTSLKKIHDTFEGSHKLPKVAVASNGYVVRSR